MPDPTSVVRHIAWREIFPWLGLLRTFRQALRLRVMLVALLAVLLTSAGWQVCGWVFSGSNDPKLQETSGEPGELVRLFSDWPWAGLVETRSGVPDTFSLPDLHERPRPVQQLLAFRQLFEWDTSLAVTSFLLLCALWALVVWSFAAGVITRVAAVALTRQEQIGLGASIDFAWRKWGSYFAGPLMPFVGVVVITLLMALFALIMRIPVVGIVTASLVWPLWLVGGLLIALLILGLAASWPLMWGTISAEGTDAFDAIGRSYGYLFGRPLHYLFYALVALVIGWIGWAVVELFAETVIVTTAWAASWGAGDKIMRPLLENPDSLEGANRFGARIFGFWNGCVRVLPYAFVYSFFWTAATAIYLLLRRDEDETDLDEVFLEEEAPGYGLPPLKTDAAGVPEPADMPDEEADEPRTP